MGYNLGIGQAAICYTDDSVSLIAKMIDVDIAPDFGFGDISGKSNYRYPSYGSFAEWAKTVDLHDMFLGEDGLIAVHPNCVPLNNEHYGKIKSAREKWEYEHKNCKDFLPSASKEPENFDELEWKEKNNLAMEYDWIYAKLVWYEFWIKWALENCTMPVFYNS